VSRFHDGVPVNYEDEPYVRLYTTDTATWELLGWEGQTVLMHMLRGKFDRAGIFSCGRHEPSRAVTAVTRLPAELVEAGLAALLREEVWVVNNGQLVWPNYHHAQTCPRSDRLRQAESRKNRAKEALAVITGQPSPMSRNVTDSHERSQASQSVTLSSSLLSLADQNKGDLVELELDISLPDLESFSPEPRKPKEPKQPSPHQAEAVQVFQAWQKATGHERAVMDPKRLNRLKARLREGHTVETLLAVLRNWRNDPWLAGSSGTTYDGIEQLFRDSAQVERLAALAAPVKAPATVSRFAPPVSPNVDFETKQRLASSRRVQAMMEGKF
jgi:hypothetical protein